MVKQHTEMSGGNAQTAKALPENLNGQKNILLISPTNVLRGGIEVFFLNLVRSAPKKYAFTWYCTGIQDEKFADEFRAQGVRIVVSRNVSDGAGLFRKGYIKARDFRKLCKTQRFDIVHVNTAKRRFQAFYLLLAKLCGIKCRIAHSHNYVPDDHPSLEYRLYRSIIVHTSTKIAGCSALAAGHLCGPRHVDHAMVFPNAIDTAQFAFSSWMRRAVREELGLTGTLVLGNVSRFKEQKNHRFMIEAFRLMAKRNDRVRLLLVGEGPTMNEMRALVRSYGIGGGGNIYRRL